MSFFYVYISCPGQSAMRQDKLAEAAVKSVGLILHGYAGYLYFASGLCLPQNTQPPKETGKSAHADRSGTNQLSCR